MTPGERSAQVPGSTLKGSLKEIFMIHAAGKKKTIDGFEEKS
jgi:hypothetical protein